MTLAADLTGLRVPGTILTVRCRRGSRKVCSQVRALWLCDCDCGGEKECTTTDLRTLRNRSCGCLMGKAYNGPKNTERDALIRLKASQGCSSADLAREHAISRTQINTILRDGKPYPKRIVKPSVRDRKILRLHNKAVPVAQIAADMGLCRSRVWQIIKRWQDQ